MQRVEQPIATTEERTRIAIDFDNTISLFSIHDECVRTLNDVTKRMRYSRVVLLADDDSHPDPLDRYTIYLAKVDSDQVSAWWSDRGKSKAYNEIFQYSDIKDLLSTLNMEFPSPTNPKPITISINENPEFIHEMRKLCDCAPGDEDNELTEEEGESLKKDTEYLWNCLVNKKVNFLGQEYSAVLVAEEYHTEVDQHKNWKTIFTTYLKNHDLFIASRNRFPEMIKKFLKHQIGLDDEAIKKIHIEAGNTGTKNKIEQMQRGQAYFSTMMVLDQTLPNPLEKGIIYVTRLESGNTKQMIAHWLDGSGNKNDQVLYYKGDVRRNTKENLWDLLQGIQPHTIINKDNHLDLLFKLALLCECVQSLRGVVYIDDNKSEFAEVEKLGGVVCPVPGSSENAGIVCVKLPDLITQAVKAQTISSKDKQSQMDLPALPSFEMFQKILDGITNDFNSASIEPSRSDSALKKQIYTISGNISDDYYDSTLAVLKAMENSYEEYINGRPDIAEALAKGKKFSVFLKANAEQDNHFFLRIISSALQNIYKEYPEAARRKADFILLLVPDDKEMTDKELRKISGVNELLPILYKQKNQFQFYGFKGGKRQTTQMNFDDHQLKGLSFEIEPKIWRSQYIPEAVYSKMNSHGYKKWVDLINGTEEINNQKDKVAVPFLFYSKKELGMRLKWYEAEMLNRQKQEQIIEQDKKNTLLDTFASGTVKDHVQVIEERRIPGKKK